MSDFLNKIFNPFNLFIPLPELKTTSINHPLKDQRYKFKIGKQSHSAPQRIVLAKTRH